MDKKAGRWLKEGKPGAGNRDEIRLGNYLLMTDSTSQLPTGERKKLKSGPSAKHPSGYFQKQHGMTASAMSSTPTAATVTTATRQVPRVCTTVTPGSSTPPVLSVTSQPSPARPVAASPPEWR